MDITPEQRDEKYKSASEAIQRLYSSAESGELMEAVFEKNMLPEAKYKTYAITIGNVILGFYPISELSTQLSTNLSIDEAKAKSITADLIDFLSPVLKEQESKVFTPPAKAGAVPQPAPETTTHSPITSTPTENHTAQSDQEPAATVETLRTMEKDMDRIHGYGAYRKLYPDVADSEPVVTPSAENAQQPSGYQALQAQVDNTIQSLSQEDMLKRPPLTGTPSYTDENQTKNPGQ